MTNGVDVRKAITVDESQRVSSFFSPQKIDADAAYQRLSLARKTLKMFQREVNDTNITDITGDLRDLYIDFEKTMQLIILEEQKLVFAGE